MTSLDNVLGRSANHRNSGSQFIRRRLNKQGFPSVAVCPISPVTLKYSSQRNIAAANDLVDGVFEHVMGDRNSLESSVCGAGNKRPASTAPPYTNKRKQ
jgi:hypothetical protein